MTALPPAAYAVLERCGDVEGKVFYRYKIGVAIENRKSTSWAQVRFFFLVGCCSRHRRALTGRELNGRKRN